MQPKIQAQKVRNNKNGGSTKKKHFTAQTASSLYKNALNIPEKFEIPDKHQIIDAKSWHCSQRIFKLRWMK